MSYLYGDRTYGAGHYGWLQELADEVGEHSFEEIEADQPEYWARRLTRQAGLDRMAATEGVTAGNLQSMLNAGLLAKDSEQCAISNGTYRTLGG